MTISWSINLCHAPHSDTTFLTLLWTWTGQRKTAKTSSAILWPQIELMTPSAKNCMVRLKHVKLLKLLLIKKSNSRENSIYTVLQTLMCTVALGVRSLSIAHPQHISYWHEYRNQEYLFCTLCMSQGFAKHSYQNINAILFYSAKCLWRNCNPVSPLNNFLARHMVQCGL